MSAFEIFVPMRTTLAIDDDVLLAAKHLAERERKSIGEVVSALARLGLVRVDAGAAARGRGAGATRNGIPLLMRQKGGLPVTLAHVNQLRDELP
jgi:hypothetical protein